MKNQAEIYEALLKGRTIRTRGGKSAMLIDGILHSLKKRAWVKDVFWFDKPEDWDVCKEWCHKDLSDGVLCKVKRHLNDEWGVDIINAYFDDSNIPYSGVNGSYLISEPLDLTKPLAEQLR